jgi:hypothetical protein
MQGSQRLGAIIMVATAFEAVLFLWALSRRSYLALALPVSILLGALNVLAFWIGWTMFTAAEEDDEDDLDADLAPVTSISGEA